MHSDQQYSQFKRGIILVAALVVMVVSLGGIYMWFYAFQPNCIAYVEDEYQTYLKTASFDPVEHHYNRQLITSIFANYNQVQSKGANQVVAVIDLPVKPHKDYRYTLSSGIDFYQDPKVNINHETKIAGIADNPHGNHIVGLINGESVGLAPHALVLPLAINNQGYKDANTKVFPQLTQYAVNNNIQIVNHANTWGTELLFYGKTKSGHIYDPYSILRTVEESNSILVLSAGNQGIDISDEIKKGADKYGSLLNHVNVLNHLIYVGVYDTKNSKMAKFSNYPGANVELQKRFISIPNIELTSTTFKDDYESGLLGTSYASAIVSASLATLMSEDVTLSSMQAAKILLETARYPCLVTNNNCKASEFGRGVLDIDNALAKVNTRKQKFWYPFYAYLTKTRILKMCDA